MNKKKIVVLLSTYNGEKYLQEQIDSILNQKSSHQIDLMVRDDGSSDGTIEILKFYEEQYPARVKVNFEKNIGYIHSFFELIREAEGYDYYALSDQDDIWYPEKMERMLRAIEDYGDTPTMVFSDFSMLQ